MFALAQSDSAHHKTKVYLFDLNQDIGPAAWRQCQKVFLEAESLDADLIMIQMNTYGGLVDVADSIRTKIINSNIPVYVYINNNAASAGALIAIACDIIIMRKGSNIGAATVVDQEGKQMPDKYQAYMRSIMRSTAESHGKVIRDGDTVETWYRDPRIAEAMVDEDIYIENIIDSGKVLSFTVSEAILNGYCEGEAETLEEAIVACEVGEYELVAYEPTFVENVIDFLLNPILQGLLIMLMIGGIYFELQTPGIGFPLVAAIMGAVLYFAPLYLEGLAENWELLLFIGGLIAIALEIFVIPGFGVAGVAGIAMVITGLALSLVDNIVFEFEGAGVPESIKAFAIVIASGVLSFFLSLYISSKIFTSKRLPGLALDTVQLESDGYIGVEMAPSGLVGISGLAATDLRPGGKVEIEGEIYDAMAISGYIVKGDKVIVVKYLTGQLYVKKEGV
jgi:membrane-bound serine protease (ClpP class)